jgi:hypothetical protein
MSEDGNSKPKKKISLKKLIEESATLSGRPDLQGKFLDKLPTFSNKKKKEIREILLEERERTEEIDKEELEEYKSFYDKAKAKMRQIRIFEEKTVREEKEHGERHTEEAFAKKLLDQLDHLE